MIAPMASHLPILHWYFMSTLQCWYTPKWLVSFFIKEILSLIEEEHAITTKRVELNICLHMISLMMCYLFWKRYTLYFDIWILKWWKKKSMLRNFTLNFVTKCECVHLIGRIDSVFLLLTQGYHPESYATPPEGSFQESESSISHVNNDHMK